MNLSELSIKRPVFAVVCSIVIIIFGVMGYSFLGVREYPAIDPPVVNVRTSYVGASAEIIETQITEPLEKAVNGVEGVKNITSSSSQGSSNITVEFELGMDLERAANDIREKVSQASGQLPQDIDSPPSVAKQDADSDPIIFMQMQSNKRTLLEISDYAENIVQERLQTISGVSGVNIFGQRPAMRIWFDPVKLAAYKLTIQDVKTALDRENIELPGGKVRGNTTELTVKAYGKLTSEDDFNNLIIKQTEGNIIRLKDIGYAILGPENEESATRKNNISSVNVAIVAQPGSNQVAIADELYKRLNVIRKDLPQDITLEVGFDKTQFVRKAITEVKETLIVAILLVVLIIYLFFREWSIAFRPLIDIPVALVGAFFIMYIAGFSINVLTLLSLVLATGLVVDDGIVVTENIFKKIEEGMDKWKAAKEGSKEIFFAVVSTSLTLAIVFLPIIFLQGFVGRLFREFGIVVAGAVLISAFVSLSLTPVLNIYLTKKNVHNHSWFYLKTEPFFKGLESGYQRWLNAFMRRRWIAFIIVAVSVASIYFIGKSLPSELAPLEDRNRLRTMITAPEGTDFDYMDKVVQDVAQKVIDSVPEKYVVLSFAPSFSGSGGSNNANVSIGLVDANTRKRSQAQIAQQMNKMFKEYSNVRVLVMQEQTISVGQQSRGSLPVQFVIQNLSFDKLKEKLPAFMDEVVKSPVFQGNDVNLKFNKPELQITINRLKASELGISIMDISNTLQLALSGRRFGYFIRNGKQYQVIGQVDRKDRDAPLDLKSFYLRSRDGELIQLDNLVSVNETANSPAIYHFNRLKSAIISAGLTPGKTIGDGIKEMKRISDKVLDDSFNTTLSGSSRDFAESSSNTQSAFLLALVLIFLILAAQFESFVDPFIIMITVPLALAGAVISLSMFGQSLNIFSQIGIIMLIGLVTKNGILIVEFANQKREQGVNKVDAVLSASVARLRPILMTTLATVLGALPIALALGSAGKSRIPLGIVIIGGLLFSLVLTLFVVPSLYSYISRKKESNMRSSFILVFLIIANSSVSAQDSAFTSKQAIDLAIQQNLEIQIAQADVEIAHTNNNFGNAGGLPIITSSITNTEAVSNINQKLSNGNAIARNNVNNNNLNGNLGISWRFFNGFKVKATKERFDALEKMGEISFKQQVDQIILQVLNSYYNILRLNKQVNATSAIIELSKERLKIAETRFNVGSGTKTDMLQAKIDLNAQEANLLEIQRQIITSTAIINGLIKRSPDAPFKVVEDQFTLPSINFKDLSEKIELQNQSLLLAQKERSNLVLERQIINSQRIPTATISSTTVLSRTKASAGLFLVNQSFGPNVGMTIGIPIFNGNINKTQLKVNSIQQKQKDLEIELLKEDLKRDLHIAYQDFLTAAKDAEMEERNVKYAEENNFISTERFKKLQSNSIELRQAQLSLSEAQNRFINAQYRAQIAANTLRFIAGEISKY